MQKKSKVKKEVFVERISDTIPCEGTRIKPPRFARENKSAQPKRKRAVNAGTEGAERRRALAYGGATARAVTRGTDGVHIIARIREFCNGYPFYALQTVFAMLLVVFGKEVEGALVFAMLISVLLVVCEDILPTTLPFLLISTFTTNCYDSFHTFMAYAPYAIIPIFALLYHFIVYRKPLRSGESVWGLIAVGVAVTLGGVGRYTLSEYVRGGYYVLGLGFGMTIVYFLMKSQFAGGRGYDLREKFAVIMVMVGTLCLVMMAIGYLRYLRGETSWPYKYGISYNNIATLLMFAMPFGVYLAKTLPFCSLFTAAFYAGLCCSYSRGGLLLGTVEFAVCSVYWVSYGRDARGRISRWLLCLAAVAGIALFFGARIWEVLDTRVFAEGAIEGSVRWQMIGEAVENFFENPLVGTGILDESIVYGAMNKAGTMAWYHMMVPQIVGSMGAIGIVAYTFQFFGRIRLILTRPTRWSLCLGISYLGILLMSQVNPGEFCPIPYGLLTVLLFILQERRLEGEALPLTDPRAGGNV